MPSPRHPSALKDAFSLDDQIAMAERAVIVRDLRIRRRADALVRHARREAIRHAGAGLLLGVGAIALTWWLKHLGRRNAPPPAAAAATAATEEHATFEHVFRDAGVVLAGLLPMLWPLLPRAWRRGLTPNAASTLLTVIAPILGRLFRRKPRERRAP